MKRQGTGIRKMRVRFGGLCSLGSGRLLGLEVESSHGGFECTFD